MLKSKDFISRKGWKYPDGSSGIYFNKNNFWIYDDCKWLNVSVDEMEDQVIQEAHEDSSFLESTHESLVRNIVRNMKATTRNPNLVVGNLIDDTEKQKKFYVPVRNGILKIDYSQGRLDYSVVPLSKNLFSTYILPYEFEPLSGCKTFIEFINQILNEDEIRIVQEWFGYNLIPVNFSNKLMIFYGSGANGKSVLLLILKLLLGEENVSCIPLQSFLPESRFGLAATEGKLANIAEEIDEQINAASGLLKQFTGGDAVPVERKFKEGFLIRPTARLTFATNSLPRFKDESDGLFRRMLILPFTRQFLDEKKQDKRLIDKNFWIDSGELSGILNWALIGLERLIANNWKFSEASSVKDILDEYKVSINPIKQFLKDYVEYAPNNEIHVAELYEKYVSHCKTYGINKVESQVFGPNVRRVFPYITQSKGTSLYGKLRSRIWYGIRLKTEDSPTIELQAQQTQHSEAKTALSGLPVQKGSTSSAEEFPNAEEYADYLETIQPGSLNETPDE